MTNSDERPSARIKVILWILSFYRAFISLIYVTLDNIYTLFKVLDLLACDVIYFKLFIK